jgi:drug/metabolite transporter (DMT)-like permease
MDGVTLGVLASLLSAATALIVARTGVAGVSPLWLLFAQYLVGAVFAPPRRLPAAPPRLHALRLLAGLWAFGGYYAALAAPGTRPAEISMVLNTAPVFAVFFATPSMTTRFGALLAFGGVILALSGGFGAMSVAAAHLLAFTAAIAYATSIVVLGILSREGEAPSTTNAWYNSMAGLCVLAALLIVRPPAPASWWPVLAVGVIAAARIQILTVAAVSPAASARVSVLSNLAFVWLAAAEAARGEHRGPAGWAALLLVLGGVALANARSSGTETGSDEVERSKPRSLIPWPSR